MDVKAVGRINSDCFFKEISVSALDALYNKTKKASDEHPEVYDVNRLARMQSVIDDHLRVLYKDDEAQLSEYLQLPYYTDKL